MKAEYVTYCLSDAIGTYRQRINDARMQISKQELLARDALRDLNRAKAEAYACGIDMDDIEKILEER